MASNLTWHAHLNGTERAALTGQRAAIIWLTGLSGSGKSTVANALDHALHALGRPTFVLDGDNVRLGLNSDLGFAPADRTENVRRVGEVAKLFVDAGIIVIVPLISPYRKDRDEIRAKVGEGQFLEVHMNTSLETCEGRDPKGLYAKARKGVIPEFTGISAPYEPPVKPELTLDAGAGKNPSELAEQILEYLRGKSYIPTSPTLPHLSPYFIPITVLLAATIGVSCGMFLRRR